MQVNVPLVIFPSKETHIPQYIRNIKVKLLSITTYRTIWGILEIYQINSTQWGILEMYHIGDKQYTVRSHYCLIFQRNTLMYITGISTDSCCLMIMMMIIVGDRSVTWSPGLVLPSCCEIWTMVATAGVGDSQGAWWGDLGLFLSVFTLALSLSLSNLIFKYSAGPYSGEVLEHDGSTQVLDIIWSCNYSRDFNGSG